MSEMRVNLRDVLAGCGQGTQAVLHNCRLGGAGASAYGREAILEFFRAQARTLDYAQVVEGRRCAALFASEATTSLALFADLHEGRITRLWYLTSPSLPCRLAERVDVPFDPDFGELGPGVVFDPAGHSELSPAHVAWLHAWSKQFFGAGIDEATPLKALAGLSRPRPYVLRAFSDGAVAAVLAMMIAYRNDGRPGLVKFPIAARLTSEQPADATFVVDDGERQAELARTWRPVL